MSATGDRSTWSSLVGRCQGDIQRQGFSVVSAFDKDLGAIYSYTVGLAHDGHPELLIVGVRPRLAERILSAAVPRTGATQRGIHEGDEIDGIVDGACLRAVSVVDTPRYLPAACELYAEANIPVDAYQLVYPGPDGKMPWEPDARGSAPLLGFEPET